MLKQQIEEFSGTDRFVVQNQIGKGTFGIVYQVYDKENNNVIALKKLRKSIYEQNSEALYRFKQEFRALADVIHPNLATLYELIFEDDKWFFTMELVEGVSFIDYVYDKSTSHLSTTHKPVQKTQEDSATVTVVSNSSSISSPSLPTVESKTTSSPLTSPNTLEPHLIARLRNALCQLAEGIDALHKAGKLHRDLKPSNVLVTLSGRVVILDFGLVIEHSVENLELDLVGTPTHMSPEQAAGHPITPASDWYSFGVILYQALTGKLPFSGKLFEVLSKKQVLDPIAPDQIAEDVPSDLSELCMALLRRDPLARPVGEEVLLCLQNKPNSALPYIPPSNSAFVGRKNLLETLHQAFLSAKNGTSNIAYISGISGIGKSSLVKHFLAQVRQNDPNHLILSGRCYEQESMPYKVFDSLIDSLAQYLKYLPEFQLIRLIPSDFLALTKLFPVLKSVAAKYAHKSVLDIPDNQELRHRAFSSLRELLVGLAKKHPVVIFIDDLQWGDTDSAALLQEIFSPPNPPAILLLASYRSEETEVSVFLQSLLNLQTEPSINSWPIEVGKLSDEESRELALSLLGENQHILSTFADIIAEEATGIPFFITELVQHIPINTQAKLATKTGNLLSSGKLGLTIIEKDTNILTSLDRTIYERVLQLPISARKLLEVIAIAGRPILRQIAKTRRRVTTRGITSNYNFTCSAFN